MCADVDDIKRAAVLNGNVEATLRYRAFYTGIFIFRHDKLFLSVFCVVLEAVYRIALLELNQPLQDRRIILYRMRSHIHEKKRLCPDERTEFTYNLRFGVMRFISVVYSVK